MHSSSRNKTKVRVLAVHTTEGIMRAVDLRAWASWPGSSHASADETGVLLAGAADGFVDYDLAAWTLRSGNPWSENIELCGFAKWKREEWLSRPLLLDACARWLGARSVARGIPLVKLSPKEYAAGRAGVIGHVDHTIGYADGTHTDPGPNFPYDVVLAKAAAYAGGTVPLSEEDDDMFSAFRSGPQYGGNGNIFMGAPGRWVPVYSMKLLQWYKHLGILRPGVGGGDYTDVSPVQLDHLAAVYSAPDGVPAPPSNVV